MMSIRRILARIASPAATTAAAALMVLVASCDHRELCYDHSHWLDLNVAFDWSSAPEASPQYMVLYLFPVDGGEPIRYELAGHEGGKIRVPAGEYHTVTFNGDLYSQDELGDSYDNFRISSPPGEIISLFSRKISQQPPRAEGTDGQPVMTSPAMMWSARSENFHIIIGEKDQTLRLAPQRASTTCHISVINVENLDYEVEYCASVTSLAEYYHPASGMANGSDVTVPVTLSTPAPDRLEGTLETFGHCPPQGSDRRHILTIYTSGRYYYNYDITDQMHTDQGTGDIYIQIDGLRLPGPEEISGGMQTDVNSWDNGETIDIEMT